MALRSELNTIKDSSVEFSASVLKNLETKKQIEQIYNPNEPEYEWRSIRGTGHATIPNFNSTYHWYDIHKKSAINITAECKGKCSI